MRNFASILCVLGLGAGHGDPVIRLGTWIERARIAPASLEDGRQDELRAILGELRLQRAESEHENGALDHALIELASLEWREGIGPELLASAHLGRDELEAELRRPASPLAARLAFEVLDVGAHRPRGERVLAAQLLGEVRIPATLTPLRAAAMEGDVELSRTARDALCGWAVPDAHLFFLDLLQRDLPGTSVAAEHFTRTRAALEAPVLARLQHEAARRYLSDDWRQAAQARALAQVLDTSRAAPVLIEALETWTRHAAAGTGSKRILGELVGALQERSGRGYGPDPALWNRWWRAVSDGKAVLPEELAARGEQLSSASFFGLQATSDRVLFVVDRSGSMQALFGTSGRSRSDEAIEQLLDFLRRSGADTRFALTLFGSEALSWRAKLAPASVANLELARRWLENAKPKGETRLFEGLRTALALDSKGRFGAEPCEADTVIVLCDGATTEGPGWVSRWLAEENERAQLVFHCVQIGQGGDGTLEALAKGTGGRFVRVQG